MWWTYVIGILVIAFVIYAFVAIARGRTRSLSRKTDLTAADLYDRYDDAKTIHFHHARGNGLPGDPPPPGR